MSRKPWSYKKRRRVSRCVFLLGLIMMMFQVPQQMDGITGGMFISLVVAGLGAFLSFLLCACPHCGESIPDRFVYWHMKKCPYCGSKLDE